MHPDPSSAKISDLQILRAAAVLGVVLQHVPGYLLDPDTPGLGQLFNYFGGLVGVDLFLVISGFIIARRLIPELQAAVGPERWSVLAHFWARRAVRLLPAAWFWLAASLALTLGFNQSGACQAFSTNFSWAVKAFLHVANFQHQAVVGTPSYGILSHYWSLSLEEQFYLVLPVVVLLAGRHLSRVLLAALAASFLLVPGDDWYFFALRPAPLLLGVLLGLGHARGWLKAFEPRFLASHWAWGPSVLVVGCLCLYTLTGSVTRFVSLKEAFLMAAWASGLLVWVGSYDLKAFSVTPWFERLGVGLGDRSYALYLCHKAAFAAATEIIFRWGLAISPSSWTHVLVVTGLAGLLLVVFTEVTYRWIEQHWRRAWAPALAELRASGQREGPLSKAA